MGSSSRHGRNSENTRQKRGNADHNSQEGMSLVVLQELRKALRDSEQKMTSQMATVENNSEIRMSGRKLAQQSKSRG